MFSVLVISFSGTVTTLSSVTKVNPSGKVTSLKLSPSIKVNPETAGASRVTLLIVIVVYYIFSIVGISLFYDELHNCYSMNSNGSFRLATDSFDNSMADGNVNNDKESISNFCSNKFNGIMDTGPTFKYSNIFVINPCGKKVTSGATFNPLKYFITSKLPHGLLSS